MKCEIVAFQLDKRYTTQNRTSEGRDDPTPFPPSQLLYYEKCTPDDRDYPRISSPVSVLGRQLTFVVYD